MMSYHLITITIIIMFMFITNVWLDRQVECNNHDDDDDANDIVFSHNAMWKPEIGKWKCINHQKLQAWYLPGIYRFSGILHTLKTPVFYTLKNPKKNLVTADAFYMP